MTAQKFSVEYGVSGNVQLVSSNGKTRTVVNTDLDVKKPTPYRMEYDEEDNILKLYAIINDVWTLKATQKVETPEQKKTIVELEQTINKLQSKLTNTTNELHEERLEVDKLRKICNNLFDVDGNGLLGDVSDE